jgi:hypothetical protein
MEGDDGVRDDERQIACAVDIFRSVVAAEGASAIFSFAFNYLIYNFFFQLFYGSLNQC